MFLTNSLPFNNIVSLMDVSTSLLYVYWGNQWQIIMVNVFQFTAYQVYQIWTIKKFYLLPERASLLDFCTTNKSGL